MVLNTLDDFIVNENQRQKRQYRKQVHIDTTQGRWSKQEHEQFMNVLRHVGIGRWTHVAKYLKNRNAKQCQSHYYKYKTQNNLTDLDVLKELGCPAPTQMLSQKAITRKNNQIETMNQSMKNSNISVFETDSLQMSYSYDEVYDQHNLLDLDLSFNICE